MCSIETHKINRINFDQWSKHFHMEVIHDQLPLAVPCYDLLPVTELTVGRDKRGRRVFPAPLS